MKQETTKKAYQEPDVVVKLLDQDDVITSSKDYITSPEGWDSNFWGGNV